jgi:hypothetical protein
MPRIAPRTGSIETSKQASDWGNKGGPLTENRSLRKSIIPNLPPVNSPHAGAALHQTWAIREALYLECPRPLPEPNHYNGLTAKRILQSASRTRLRSHLS